MAENGALLEKAISGDGTPIAYWRSGSGPGLVLVHGTTADHSRWETVLPLLEPHVTVYAIDRRGRGGSGDATDYSIEDEFGDVAAVVDAIGEPVDLLGHSYGALCALEASMRTAGVRRLVLYEPPLGPVAPREFVNRLATLHAQGQREETVTAVLEFIGMPPEQIELVKSLPSWPNRVAAAHTVVREFQAEEAYVFQPERFAALTVPTLLLVGTDSPPEILAAHDAVSAAVPDAGVVTLSGQGHVAMLTAPDLFAREVLRFLHASTA